MEGISDVFNSIRGFNMSVQVAVQSLSQWKEKYPGTEWENQLNAFDQTVYMGCNDLTSARYFAEKCGKVTISVTNNQFPLAPLFSPIYSTTRPYSQTRSNTQRDLMQADEFLRLDKYKCIVMFNHHKPAQLYKVMLEALPEFQHLSKCSVFDYVPEWKKRETAEKSGAPGSTSIAPSEPPMQCTPSVADEQTNSPKTQRADEPVKDCISNTTPEQITIPTDIGLVEMTRDAVIGSIALELDDIDTPARVPPGRGI